MQPERSAAQDRAPRFGETSEAGSVPDTKEGTNEGRDKSPDVCSDRDPRFLETSAMGSLPDNKEGRDEGHEVGPGRSRGSSDERTGSDGNAGLRPGPTATFCECPPETPASYIDGAPGGAYCDECDKPVRPKASAAYTEEQLHAALIFWIARCRRFEEKLDQFGYMKARGVLRPEFALGNRIFEESLPTVEDIVGLVPDMNPEAE